MVLQELELQYVFRQQSHLHTGWHIISSKTHLGCCLNHYNTTSCTLVTVLNIWPSMAFKQSKDKKTAVQLRLGFYLLFFLDLHIELLRSVGRKPSAIILLSSYLKLRSTGPSIIFCDICLKYFSSPEVISQQCYEIRGIV